MVRVGIRIVKQYTTPSTINLYCSGMIRRYENTNRIRNATKGMENGVNITETALAALMRVLSVMICCCSMAISLVLHYHSFVIPLKFFFNDGYVTEDGEEMSVREIRKILKECIDSEDKKKPYTDDELTEILKEKGYPIARRTVAKYRQQLNIPVARLRR